MSELLTAVRAGRKEEVVRALAGMDRAARKEALAELKSLRKEARSWGWSERATVRHALLVAGAGCHTGAAACAAWIGGQDLRDWSGTPYALLLDVLADRDPAWLGDLAHRLAARPSTSTESDYRLIQELVRVARCPLPVTDGLVGGWVTSVNSARWQGKGRSRLVDILRAEPHVATLATALFEGTEPPPGLFWYDRADMTDDWPNALAALVGEGVLERRTLADRSVSRLLRGGKPGDLRFSLTMVRALELTEDEEAARVADWIAMASDGGSAVAGHAQQVLVRLDARGALSTHALADVSASVLFRTEKKLVRAQLTLLGAALRRDRATAGQLLPVIAEAFGHEDMDIRGRALRLIARHLSGATPALREDLAFAAGRLGPMHRAAARDLFGDLPADDEPPVPYEETLPPVPEPRPLGAAASTVAELVEEVSALIKSRSREAPSFERALDGLVRHARTDRTALTEALREALAGVWWLDDQPQDRVDRWFAADPGGLDVVAAALLGQVSGGPVKNGRKWRTATGTCAHAALNGVLYARVWEVAALLPTGQLPFLLATPTWHTGALEPAELVERLRTYRHLGARPGPVDFAQALLRVRRSGTEAEAVEAALLGTEEGDRLAAWLRADEPVARVLPHGLDSHLPTPGDWHDRGAPGKRWVLLSTGENPVLTREFPRAFQWLGRSHHPLLNPCYHWTPERSGPWSATLPQDAEAVAAWLMPTLLHGTDEGMRGGAWALPALVEAGGPPGGEALHLALAYGLGSRHPDDRLSSVDALLILAAQDRLDPALLGRELAVLIDHDLTKVNRLADAARTAATTGAYRTVLEVLSAALPSLLGYQRAPRALGSIVAVAAECAEQCGPTAGGSIAGLAETAARGGSTQLVRQAARLLAAWEAGAGADVGAGAGGSTDTDTAS
ncbi:DUF7824 domain-containing protein [Streptomyces halstedii]|uniref:DUF7824 domain-containing protein n=1 Tax=Streptomyces halstedii TaxID=1944 RepID=UPI00382EC7CE